MANTYHQIYSQTVFAVKYREAVIEKERQAQLFGVIGNLINEANGKVGEGPEFIVRLPFLK